MKKSPGKVGAVIAAAGSGERFGERKQFKSLGKRPLLFHALTPFLRSNLIAEVVVVVPEDVVAQTERELRSLTSAKPVRVVKGGPLRQDSVLNGVEALSADVRLVCIHDAARPFATTTMITDTVKSCEHHDGAIVAVPARDTVKLVAAGGHHIEKTLPRETIWLAQTPQTFHREPLVTALKSAVEAGIAGTDESALMERLGYEIAVVEGSFSNLKITTEEDWEYLKSKYNK